MNWNGKKVLVTGGGGFIGSHLTERLVELGASTRALVHYNALGSWGWLDHSPLKDQVEVVSGDICDRDSVHNALHGVDVVFHLAALIAIPYSYRAPESYVRTNIIGTLNVLQAARELGTERVVHTSTSEVYGTAQFTPMDEGHPLQGQSPYSASKIGADKLVESFYRSYNLPAVTVRPFNTYGPRQSARAVIPTIITQALTSDCIHLGNLDARRDFTYVRDTVDGFLRAAVAPDVAGRELNLGTGSDISVGELAGQIIRLVNRPVEIATEEERLRPEKSEVMRLLSDNGLARQMLGWEPAYSLEDGLRETIAWIGDHLDFYNVGRYEI